MEKINKKASVVASCTLIVFCLLVIALLSWRTPNSSGQTQGDYTAEVAFPNLTFNQPVGIVNSEDGTNRLFVIEQTGVIQVFNNSRDAVSSSVFLNISSHVVYGGEQGLLGLAFHPKYNSNRYFYVDYVANNPLRTVIARFSVSPNNPNRALNDSEVVLLEVNQPFSNHKGGQIAFGADGYLYIGLGDGGSGGDPFGNAQNRTSLLGKTLRINVDSSSQDRNYDIPVDNPYAGNALGYREEIYAYGFRNPWRFSFDELTGRLWDVGQDLLEEIDVVEKGKNYGWNIMEGTLTFSVGSQVGLVLPVWEYNHTEGIAIIGGYVHRGSTLTGLYSKYIYGDYGSGKVWVLQYDGVVSPVNTLLVNTGLNISSFGVDEQNELYFCTLSGKIYFLKANTISTPSLPIATSTNAPSPTVMPTSSPIFTPTPTSSTKITSSPTPAISEFPPDVVVACVIAVVTSAILLYSRKRMK